MLNDLKKDLNKISGLINQKQDFDKDLQNVLDIIQEETNLKIDQKEILVKKNIYKIKSDSNIRFLILLRLDKINKRVKDLNSSFILEM